MKNEERRDAGKNFVCAGVARISSGRHHIAGHYIGKWRQHAALYQTAEG